MKNTIYPNIDVKEATVIGSFLLASEEVVTKHIMLFTRIRKLHTDGKWYLMNVMKRGTNMKYEDIFNQFIKEVYNYQILGIVSTDVVDMDGKSICELDRDQRSEEERLKSF